MAAATASSSANDDNMPTARPRDALLAQVLHPDILTTILAHVAEDRPSLRNAIYVARSWFIYGLPYLYRSIDLTLDDLWSPLDIFIPPTSELSKVRCLARTETLYVRAHVPEQCAAYAKRIDAVFAGGLQLPSLQTLLLDCAGRHHHLPSEICHVLTCPLVCSLAPRRLILARPYADRTGNAQYVLPIPPNVELPPAATPDIAAIADLSIQRTGPPRSNLTSKLQLLHIRLPYHHDVWRQFVSMAIDIGSNAPPEARPHLRVIEALVTPPDPAHRRTDGVVLANILRAVQTQIQERADQHHPPLDVKVILNATDETFDRITSWSNLTIYPTPSPSGGVLTVERETDPIQPAWRAECEAKLAKWAREDAYAQQRRIWVGGHVRPPQSSEQKERQEEQFAVWRAELAREEERTQERAAWDAKCAAATGRQGIHS